MSNLYGPSDFEEGERVRIYSIGTNKTYFLVRQGRVVSNLSIKSASRDGHDSRLALMLETTSIGAVDLDEFRNGSRPKLRRTKRSNRKYAYDRIALVDRV